jgi:hypothetical protein
MSLWNGERRWGKTVANAAPKVTSTDPYTRDSLVSRSLLDPPIGNELTSHLPALLLRRSPPVPTPSSKYIPVGLRKNAIYSNMRLSDSETLNNRHFCLIQYILTPILSLNPFQLLDGFWNIRADCAAKVSIVCKVRDYRCG